MAVKRTQQAQAMIDVVNQALLSEQSTREQRIAICIMLETQLHTIRSYKGFGYIGKDQNYPFYGWDYDAPTYDERVNDPNRDDTRRFYY